MNKIHAQVMLVSPKEVRDNQTLWVILQAFVFFRWPNPGPKWSNACPMPIIVYLKCHEPFANPFRSPQVDLSIFEECNADRQIASFV